MKKRYIAIGLVFFIFVFGIYLYFENTSLTVSEYVVENSKIDKEFENFKIVHISDFHNDTSDKLTNDIVLTTKKQSPNIIVITGDLIDSRRTKVNVAIDFVSKLKEIAPIYYVNGNHEHRVEEYKTLKNSLEKLGVTILENKVANIEINNKKINLLGINDPSFANEPFVDDSEIVQSYIKSLKYDENLYTILLSHRPEMFETYVDEKIDLAFTGHAHGGQIRLPFIGGLIAPNQGLIPKFTGGEYNKENTKMILSRGLGNSIFPFRVNNRPELVVVKLKTTN